MEINIPLPNNYTINTYKELYNYLKQLELAIHHAQKAVQTAEESEIAMTEDCIVTFKHPSLEDKIVDENYDELQSIELSMQIQ